MTYRQVSSIFHLLQDQGRGLAPPSITSCCPADLRLLRSSRPSRTCSCMTLGVVRGETRRFGAEGNPVHLRKKGDLSSRSDNVSLPCPCHFVAIPAPAPFALPLPLLLLLSLYPCPFPFPFPWSNLVDNFFLISQSFIFALDTIDVTCHFDGDVATVGELSLRGL